MHTSSASDDGTARVEPDAVLAAARRAGFALAGVAEARRTSYAAQLREWLAAGCHGDMTWLERNEAVLCDPSRFVLGARSVICVADRYADGRPDRTDMPRFGRIARYARGRDYHRVMERRLRTLAADLAAGFPQEVFRVCVDAAPLLEREHAERAGVGAIGKHSLLLERGSGSWLLLGEIVTTLGIRPSHAPAPSSGIGPGRHNGDPCGTCTRCIDACPTDAITPYRVDARRCISYLTIEHRGPIDPALHEGIGAWLFGCDVCQEVCPHGQSTRRSKALPVHEAYAPRRSGFDLLEVLGWSEEDRRRAFETSSLKRAKLDMMKRNAIIVAGNLLQRTPDAPLLARLRQLADDGGESELVRITAQQTLRRLMC